MQGKFELGQILATPAALQVLEQADTDLSTLLSRHAAGDWGDLDVADMAANDMALRDGSRILSAYELADGQRLWLITEAIDHRGRRCATTCLLPAEY